MASRFSFLALALLSGAIATFASASAQDRSIVVASTTSTQDSGLFGYLLPIFKAKTGIDIDAAKGSWYREIGQGMGAALNTAGAMNAYVLSDRGTWISFKNRGDLEIIVEGDKRLFNQYGVMLVNPEKHPSVKKELGQSFIDWLVSPEGQAAIAGYKIDGQQLFFPDAEKKGT